MRFRSIAFLAVITACGAPAPRTPTPAASTGTLVVLNKSAKTASLVAPSDGTTFASIPTGDGPHEIAVTADGKRAIVSNYGTPKTPGNTVSLLDIEGRRSLATIDLGAHRHPHGLAWLPDGRRFVVTSETSRALLVVDAYARRVDAPIPIGEQTTHMVAVAPDGKIAYTANIGSGSVTMVDLVSTSVIRTTATGAGAEGIDVAPDGARVWVTNRGANTISVLDAKSLDVVATVETTAFPIRVKLTPDGRRALVSHARASELAIFDATTMMRTATIAFPLDPAKAVPTMFGDTFGGSAIPIGVLIAPGGTTAYVATAATDEIHEIDIDRAALSRAFRAGREPDGMAWAR